MPAAATARAKYCFTSAPGRERDCRHQYLTEFTQESTQKAIAWFQQALALDPGYAAAYSGLASCYYLLSNIYYPPTEMMPKAKAAAQKALELDDTLGEAHAMLALVRSSY